MEFGARLPLSHSQGHGSESIDHNGASEHRLESGSVASPPKEPSGEKPSLAAGGGREGRGGGGERGRRKVCGENGGRKAILWSFKELLFHAKLKSHYRDYMPANNVRQISI